MSRTRRKHEVSHGTHYRPESRPHSRRGDHVFTHLIARPLLPAVELIPTKTRSVIEFGWVPNKKRAARLTDAENVREQRLDLLQVLGAEMLKPSFDS